MLAVQQLVLLAAVFDFTDRSCEDLERNDTSIWESVVLYCLLWEIWFCRMGLLYGIHVSIDASLWLFVFWSGLDPCDDFASDDSWPRLAIPVGAFATSTSSLWPALVNCSNADGFIALIGLREVSLTFSMRLRALAREETPQSRGVR